MKLLLRLILVVFFANLFIGGVYASVCCYNPASGIILYRDQCIANQNEIDLFQNYGIGYYPDFVDESQACDVDLLKLNNDIGYSICDYPRGRLSVFDGGKPIIRIGITYFPEGVVEACNNLGGSMVISSERPEIGLGDDPFGYGDVGQGDSVVDPEVSQILFDPTDRGLDPQIRNLCSNFNQAGDLFSYTFSKDYCNNIGTAPLSRCVYNPVYGGEIYSHYDPNFLHDENEFQSSCVALAEIKYCEQYTTEENCEYNYALRTYSGSKEYLKDGCVWLRQEDFGNENPIFESQNGICLANISDYNGNLKSYKKYNLGKRNNMLKNPSFEGLNLNPWQTGVNSPSHVDYAHFGEKGLNFTANGQNISQVFTGVYEHRDIPSSFAFQGYFKSSKPDDEIKVILWGKNHSESDYIKIDEFNFDFSNVGQDTYEVPSKIVSIDRTYQVMKLELECVECSDGLYVDDLSFYSELSVTYALDLSSIFKPVSLLAADTSSCELCYDGLNLDSCTKVKADYLGDCEYMTSGIEEAYKNQSSGYLAKEYFYDELGLNNYNKALARSKVFCELYMTENSCTNESNFVNSQYSVLHPKTDNLCKWDSYFGCYKDSNNDNAPDYLSGFSKEGNVERYFPQTDVPEFINVNIKGVSFSSPDDLDGIDLFPQTWDSGHVAYDGSVKDYIDFNYDSNNDFPYYCDMIPPNVYILFSAIDSNGEIMYFDKNSIPDIEMGSVNISIEAQDLIEPETCDFAKDDIVPKIYVSYGVGDNYFYKEFDGNEFVNGKSVPIKEFFVNPETGKFLFEDTDEREIFLEIIDQSGNVGFTTESSSGVSSGVFTFDNIDLDGPTITIDSHNLGQDIIAKNVTDSYSLEGKKGKLYKLVNQNTQGIYTVKSLESFFNFTIRDEELSELENCSYVIRPEPVSGNSIDDDFYNHSVSLPLEESSTIRNTDSEAEFEVDLRKLIFDASENAQYYILSVSCNDVFEQETNYHLQLKVDYKSLIELVSPPSYNMIDEQAGAYNTSTLDLTFYGKDRITNCKLYDDGGYDEANLVDKAKISYFDAQNPAPSGYEDYKSNVTAQITFGKGNGKYVYNLRCLDENDNVFDINDITYYYDTEAPELVNFENLSATRYYVDADGNAYSTDHPGDISLKYIFNSTGPAMSANVADYTFESFLNYEDSDIFEPVIDIENRRIIIKENYTANGFMPTTNRLTQDNECSDSGPSLGCIREREVYYKGVDYNESTYDYIFGEIGYKGNDIGYDQKEENLYNVSFYTNN
jgi:hypothetical protein